MVTRVTPRGEKWTMVAVYVNGDMENKLERIREWMEKQSEEEGDCGRRL